MRDIGLIRRGRAPLAVGLLLALTACAGGSSAPAGGGGGGGGAASAGSVTVGRVAPDVVAVEALVVACVCRASCASSRA